MSKVWSLMGEDTKSIELYLYVRINIDLCVYTYINYIHIFAIMFVLAPLLHDEGISN